MASKDEACTSRAKRRLLTCEGGVSVVEFALVLPVLLVLLLGAIDFGHVVLERAKLSAVVRAGTQYAAFTPGATNAAITAAAIKGASGMSPAPTVAPPRRFCACSTEVTCTATCTDGSAPAEFVELTATTSVTLTFSYPFISSPVALSRTLRSGVL